MTTIATKYPFVGYIESKTGGRNENQDCAGFVDTALGLLLVVCDGAGGGPGGRTASHMAVETILNELTNVSEHTSRYDALKYGIDKANDVIYGHALERPELRGMATTVVAMIINEDSAVIAHAGDSRIYLLRKEKIIFRSNDHSVVADLVRNHRLTEEEARNHPQSNRITLALGIKPTVEAEYDEVAFKLGDRFVLCTDGIWGSMPQPELVKALSRRMGIYELTEDLANQIDQIGKNGGGGHDNLTLAILDPTFRSTRKQKKSFPRWLLPVIILLLAVIVAIVAFFITRKKKTETLHLPQPVQSLPISNNSSSEPEQTPPADNRIAPQPTEASPVDNRTPLQPTHTSPTETQASPQPRSEQLTVDGATAAHGHEIPETSGNLATPFQEHSSAAEMREQLNTVISELNKLRNMRGGTRKQLSRRKKEYIQNEILPRVNKMMLLAPTNMDDLIRIREMLADERAFRASSSRGRGAPDIECNKLIEGIISLLKNMQQ